MVEIYSSKITGFENTLLKNVFPPYIAKITGFELAPTKAEEQAQASIISEHPPFTPMQSPTTKTYTAPSRTTFGGTKTYTAPSGTTFGGTNIPVPTGLNVSKYLPQNTLLAPTEAEEQAQASIISEHPPFTPMPSPTTKYGNLGSIYTSTLESEKQIQDLLQQTGGEVLEVEQIGTNIMGGSMVKVTFAEPHPQLISREISVTSLSELEHEKQLGISKKQFEAATPREQQGFVAASSIFDYTQSSKFIGTALLEIGGKKEGLLGTISGIFGATTKPFSAAATYTNIGRPATYTNIGQIFKPTPAKKEIAIETMTLEAERTKEWDIKGYSDLDKTILRGWSAAQSIPAAPVTWFLGGVIAGGLTIAGGKALAPALAGAAAKTGAKSTVAKTLLWGGETVAKHPVATTSLLGAGYGALEGMELISMKERGAKKSEILGEAIGGIAQPVFFGLGFGKAIGKTLTASARAAAKTEATYLKAYGMTGEVVEPIEAKALLKSAKYSPKVPLWNTIKGEVMSRLGKMPAETFMEGAKKTIKKGTQTGTTATGESIFESGAGAVAVATKIRPKSVITPSRLGKNIKGIFKAQDIIGDFGTSAVTKRTVLFVPTKTLRPPKVKAAETKFIRGTGGDKQLIDNLRVAWSEEKMARIQTDYEKQDLAKRKFLEAQRPTVKLKPRVKPVAEEKPAAREFGAGQKYKLLEEEQFIRTPDTAQAAGISLFAGQRTIYTPISVNLNRQFQRGQTSISAVSMKDLTKQASISVNLQPSLPSLNKQAQNLQPSLNKQAQIMITTQKQKMGELFGTSQITWQGQRTTSRPKEEPIIPFPVPPIVIPEGWEGFKTPKGKKPSNIWKAKTGYRPSMLAVGESIKAPKGWKVPKSFTGLEIRPIKW